MKKINLILAFFILLTSFSFANELKDEAMKIEIDEDSMEIEFKRPLMDTKANLNYEKIYILKENSNKEDSKEEAKLEYEDNIVYIDLEQVIFEANKKYYLCIDKSLEFSDGSTLNKDIKEEIQLDKTYQQIVNIDSKILNDAIRKELNGYNGQLSKGILNNNIYEISIDKISDINTIKEIYLLKNLELLELKNSDLRNSKKLDTSNFLKDFAIDLVLQNCNLNDLTLLESTFEIGNITLDNCKLNDLKGIDKIDFLMGLRFRNMNLENIDMEKNFSNLEELKRLSIYKTKVDNLKFLKSLNNLYFLNINADLDFDCKNLELCKNIVIISLNVNDITNIDALKNLNKLKNLSIFESKLNKFDLNESIGKITSLNALYIPNCKIKNIDFIKNLDELESLNIESNKELENIDILNKMPNLDRVTVSKDQMDKFKDVLNTLENIEVEVEQN